MTECVNAQKVEQKILENTWKASWISVQGEPVTGDLKWNGKQHVLKSGINSLQF